MSRRLAYTSLLIDDYDVAVDHFTRVLGFVVLEDERIGESKRWIVVAPSAEGSALLLAKANTDEQRALIGKQGGGRVWLFLHTDDFDREHARLQRNGIRFEETPREEAYGKVAVFVDRWGNRWDLVQRIATGTADRPTRR